MKLSKMLSDWRWTNRLSLMDVAKEIGVTASTLHRLESGKNIDGITMTKLMIWMFSESKQKDQRRRKDETRN